MSATSTSGPFGAGPTEAAGDTSHGGGGRDVTKSDGSGSRQAGESTGAAVAGAGALAVPAAGALAGGATPAATWTLGASTLGAFLAPITAFLGITLYSQATIVDDADELAMLAASKLESAKRTKAGTGTTAIPIPAEEAQRWYAVRVQAQGGGLEKSVPIRQATPVTVAQGLAALAALKAQLTPTQLRERSVAFTKAAAWILSRPPYGAGPPGKSGFVDHADKRGDIRVDVEILDGVNFTQ